MAVTITPGERQTNDTYQSSETLTQSTATAFQSLSLRTDVSVLGMGTATGTALRNIYRLATTAVEGQEKLVISSATGQASVLVPMPSGRIGIIGSSLAVPSATAVDAVWASATGMWVFESDGDFLLCKFLNGTWQVIGGSGATLATTT
jgi:hypothetical protein